MVKKIIGKILRFLKLVFTKYAGLTATLSTILFGTIGMILDIGEVQPEYKINISHPIIFFCLVGLTFLCGYDQKSNLIKPKTTIADWRKRRELKTIPVSKMINGAYYVGKTNQRGMPIGKWIAKENKFLCINDAGFDHWEIYRMNHIDNDDGLVCFEPVIKIDL